MAQESKDKEREVDEDDGSESEGSSEGEGSSETMRAGDDQALTSSPTRDAGQDGGDPDEGEDEAGEEGDGEEGEGQAAAQLGSDRYVLAGFFAAGMLGAYILGRALQSAWTAAANKSWFAEKFRVLAAVSENDQGTYGILIGGVVALVVVYRTRPRSPRSAPGATRSRPSSPRWSGRAARRSPTPRSS